MKRAPRLVSVALRGRPIKQTGKNEQRLELLAQILRAIDAQWSKVDAILLPGGFFRLPQFVGHLTASARLRSISAAGLNFKVAKRLAQVQKSPDVFLVAGVTSPGPGRGEWGDQACLAWDRKGIAGFARKIFPVARGRDPEADGFVVSVADYDNPNRIIRLASGHNAILCACYDMFGLAERTSRNGVQAHGIWWLRESGERMWRAATGMDRADCVSRWETFVRRSRVTVALSSIHLFKGPTSYWQRHGIATASAALQGYAVGAAHFERLPNNPAVSTLAAAGVPKSHLLQGVERQSHSWQPVDAIQLKSALIRLYE